MAKKIVTLFIRDTNINLLVMKGRRVDKWASLSLEPGLVSQGLILDEAQVAGKVKELLRRERVTASRVIAGLSGLNSLYRMITVPELPEAILPEAITHEAGRALPVSLDEVYLSYQPVPAPKGETRVFLAAFPRNVTDALLKTLQRAGLETYVIDLAPLALCRIPNEPRAIIVNARLDHFDIMVIADRLPQVIRRLSLPSEAESLSEKLPAITEEFGRTVAFYNVGHLEKPLDSTVPVFVCGELAEVPETWQSLVDKLDFSVSPLPSPVEYPEGFNSNEFMVNIGLALKELLPEKGEGNFSLVNFNAMPEVYQPKAPSMRRILVPIGIVVGIGLLAYAGALVQNSVARTSVLRSQLALTETRIIEQQKETATVKEQIAPVEAQIAPVEAQIELVEATTGIFNATLTGLEEGREKVDGDLSQIAALVPADIALLYGGETVEIDTTRLDPAEINHDAEQVMVKGVAPNEDEIFKYARALRSSGRFSMVIITSIEAYEEVKGEDEEGEAEEKEIEKGFNFEFLLISNTRE